MEFVAYTVLGAAAAAGVAGLALMRKAINRRIRLLSLSVVLMTLCQATTNAIHLLGMDANALIRSVEVLQLTAIALALAVVHLLNRENRDRSNVEVRLRVLEPKLDKWEDSAKLLKGLAESHKDRNLETGAHAAVEVFPGRAPQEMAVRIAEHNEQNLRFTSPAPITPNSLIRMDYQGRHIVGNVTECEPSDAGFTIDVARLAETLASHKAKVMDEAQTT